MKKDCNTTLELKDSIRETRTLCATAEPTARLTSKCRTRKNQMILTGSSMKRCNDAVFPKSRKKNGVKILSRFGHNFHSKIIRQIQRIRGIWGKSVLQNVK